MMKLFPVIFVVLLVGTLGLLACTEGERVAVDPICTDLPNSHEECVALGGEVPAVHPELCYVCNYTYLMDDFVPELTLVDKCNLEGGVWLEEPQECEGVSKETCDELGGRFNECASACRNDPEAVVCTMQCVFVCEFAVKRAEESVDTFIVGPELRDCEGVGPQQCMVVNDMLFYDSIADFKYEEGYTYELRVAKVIRQNPGADQSKFAFELLEVVSKMASE